MAPIDAYVFPFRSDAALCLSLLPGISPLSCWISPSLRFDIMSQSVLCTLCLAHGFACIPWLECCYIVGRDHMGTRAGPRLLLLRSTSQKHTPDRTS